MSRPKLANHYGSLTPSERFELALAALSRQDGDEISRLYSTCPRESYSVTDPAFHLRFQAIRAIIMTFTVMVLEGLVAARALHAAFVCVFRRNRPPIPMMSSTLGA